MTQARLHAAFAAAALALAVTAARAQPALTGAGKPGAANTYTQSAVRFTQLSGFGTASALTSAGTTVAGGDTGALADSSQFTFAFSLKALKSSTNYANTSARSTIHDTDFISMQGASPTYSSEGVPGMNLAVDAADGYGTLRINLGDSGANATNASGAHTCDFAIASGFFSGVAQHFLIEGNTGQTGTAENVAVYQNGVKLAGGCNYSTGGPMSIHWSNPNGWAINTPSFGDLRGEFELADVYMDFAHSDVDTSNNLSAAAVCKFYCNGGPVSLGAHGQLPYGVPAHIFLSGDKTTFGTNKGTITGLSVLAGALYNAPASLTTIPANAYVDFAVESNLASSITTITTDPAGYTIPAGALVMPWVAVEDSSNGTGNHGLGSTFNCPSGFSSVYAAWDNGAANNPTLVMICQKIAGSGETGQYTFNWTTNNTRGGHYGLIVVRGEDSSAPIDAVGGTKWGSAAQTTTWSAPSISPANAGDLMLTFNFSYFTGTFTIPSGQDQYDVDNQAFLDWEVLSASGATGTRSGTTPSSSGQAVNIAIKHP